MILLNLNILDSVNYFEFLINAKINKITAPASDNIPMINIILAPGQCISLNNEPMIVTAIPMRNNTKDGK